MMITQMNSLRMMNNSEKAIHQHLSKTQPVTSADGCACLGPEDGEPACPCAMRWVELVDNEYYRIHVNSNGVAHTAEFLGKVGDFDPWNKVPKTSPSPLQIALERNRLKMQNKK